MSNVETLEQSANVIWGMARDLAQTSFRGTSLNCERNVKYIASLLEAYAVKHAEASIVVMEVLKTAGYSERIRQLMAEVKDLKSKLAGVKKGKSRSKSQEKKKALAVPASNSNGDLA